MLTYVRGQGVLIESLLWFTIPPYCGSLLRPRPGPRPPSAYRALPCLAARSRSATRASAAPHPAHPAQPPAAQPPFAGPPPWSWQSQVPRRTRRRTASTASATMTRPMMTVAGLISKGSPSRLLPSGPLSGASFFRTDVSRETFARTRARTRRAPSARCVRRSVPQTPYATYARLFSASSRAVPPEPSYFGMGRNSWNSSAASTTNATAVHTPNPPPESSVPNW